VTEGAPEVGRRDVPLPEADVAPGLSPPPPPPNEELAIDDVPPSPPPTDTPVEERTTETPELLRAIETDSPVEDTAVVLERELDAVVEPGVREVSVVVPPWANVNVA